MKKNNGLFFIISSIILFFLYFTPLVTVIYSGETKYSIFSNVITTQSLFGWAFGNDDGFVNVNLIPSYYGLFFTIAFFLPFIMFVIGLVKINSKRNSKQQTYNDSNSFPFIWIITLTILIVSFLTYSVECSSVRGFAIGGMRISSYIFSFSIGTYLIIIFFVCMILHSIVSYVVNMSKKESCEFLTDKEINELRTLKKLVEENILTLDEYNDKKDKILNKK